MDFLSLDDHDNGWIPSGTDTAYKEQWDSLFNLHDDLGTVTKVIGINGKTSAHYNYDEFGRPLGAVKLDPNWSGPDNAISYTGYTYDHFAELYYAQARYYLPDIGRFISQDPWAGDMTQPGTLNSYPYVLNNPLKYVDPTGLILGPSLTDREIEKQLERTKKYTNYGNMVRTPASNSNAVGTAWNEYEDKINKTDGGSIDWDYYEFLYQTGQLDQIPDPVLAEIGGLKEPFFSPLDLIPAGGFLGKSATTFGKVGIEISDRLLIKISGGKVIKGAGKTTWGMWDDLAKATYKGREYAEINGRYFTREAVDRMTPKGYGTAAGGYQARGIPTSVVEDVITNGTPREVIRNGVIRTIFEHNGVRVVTEEGTKIVITTLKY